MVSNQRSHYFETLLLRFGNTQPMEQTHREQRRDYASQNWRLLFITFARENGEQGAPKAGFEVVTGGQKLQALLPARSREEPLATLPRYISVSFGEQQPLLQREVPLLQFWESLSGQNMFSGAVICILGAKKILVRQNWAGQVDSWAFCNFPLSQLGYICRTSHNDKSRIGRGVLSLEMGYHSWFSNFKTVPKIILLAPTSFNVFILKRS